MEKKRLELKSRRTGEYVEYDGVREYTEVVDMGCVRCGYEESVDADMVFECWEMCGGPFPAFDCPRCGHGTMIPRQVIEETEAEEEKEKHLGRPKRKRR